jgi:hypothetical protein
MAKRAIQELKEELQKIKEITPWSEIEVNHIYHIPPIISLDRREVMIVDKTDSEAKYIRVDSGENSKEGKMHRTSVFARFLIKKKSF